MLIWKINNSLKRVEMLKEEYLVSIIIPSYKNIVSLKRAINSAINQTYSNIEVIVVDDNEEESVSHTQTQMVVNECSDNRVKYIYNGSNRERSYSRNNGVNHSKGDFLMFLDNDDEFMSKKVESQLECLLANGEEYAACYSNYIRKNNNKIVGYCAEQRTGNLLFDTLCRNLFVHPGSNLMIRRNCFLNVGGFREDLNINEDIDLLIKLQIKYKICYCNELGLIVNLHGHPNLNYIEKSQKYIEAEKNIWSKLSPQRRKMFFRLIGLQMLRSLGIKNIKKSVSIIRKYDIPKTMLIKYLMYLGWRFLSKKAYSFKV